MLLGYLRLTHTQFYEILLISRSSCLFWQTCHFFKCMDVFLSSVQAHTSDHMQTHFKIQMLKFNPVQSTGAETTCIFSHSFSVVEKQWTEVVLLHCSSHSIHLIHVIMTTQKGECILVSDREQRIVSDRKYATVMKGCMKSKNRIAFQQCEQLPLAWTCLNF